jgi:pteridine reductase
MERARSKLREGGVALITGGARRIGAAIARTLHLAGMRVAVHYNRSGSEAEALVARLEELRPDSAAAFAGDLLDVEAIPELVARVLHRWGGLDVLVNNASSFYPTPIGEITDAAWEDLVGTNLRAPLFLAQAAASALRDRGGCIVNITDIHGERPLPGYPVYSAAKAGLIALTRALAVELGPRVRVNAVSPGAILWAEHEQDEAEREAILDATALGRKGDPADIAAAVLYFARDARYVTGAVLPVDGGRSARSA